MPNPSTLAADETEGNCFLYRVRIEDKDPTGESYRALNVVARTAQAAMEKVQLFSNEHVTEVTILRKIDIL
jgi:hypothetical protein